MDPFRPHSEALRNYSSTLMRPKMDSYKVDEGYSEDTRSQDGSETSMKPELSDGRVSMVHSQPSVTAQLADLVRGLGEHERSGENPGTDGLHEKLIICRNRL